MIDDFSPFPEKPVLVIGASGIDFVGKLETELVNNSSNPAKIRTSFGGVSRNVAENIAKLGHPVKFISAIGDDQAGDDLINHLLDAGVDVEHCYRCIDCPTGSYLAVLDSSGELKFALDDMRAISTLTSEYLRSKVDLFRDASLVFIDSNLSEKVIRTVFTLARRSKIPVCADPTSTRLVYRLKPYLNKIKMLTPNNAEASTLSNKQIDMNDRVQAINAAKYFVNNGVDIAIISLAQFGVCYATSKTSGHIPAIKTNIVDPTGAGDALSSAVIYSLLNGINLDEAIRLGVTAAAMTLRYPGSVLEDLTLEKLYGALVI